MKRILDAYQKITAPEGLRERIEAQVQAGRQTEVSRGTMRWFDDWRKNVLVIAVTAVCLFVAVGVIGVPLLRREEPESVPGIQLAMEEGDILGARQVSVDMVSEETQTFSSMSWKTEATQAAIFHVRVDDPVTFTADRDCLSVYDEEKKRWTDCERELIIESESALCVLLPALGDDEVFKIQMSSARNSSWIEIVYDEAAGEYKAACKTKIGE